MIEKKPSKNITKKKTQSKDVEFMGIHIWLSDSSYSGSESFFVLTLII